MRVLITNLFVKNYSGSENVAELLADGLRRTGHQPLLFATSLGEQALSLRRRGFSVVDRAEQLTERPDVIHGQHLTPCLVAMTRFPGVPVVYSCHSSLFDVEAPLPHPQIREVIAVDESCAAKCREVGVATDRLSIVLNAVDLDRFQRRGPLPATPRKALLLTKNRGHRAAVCKACENAGIELEELGPATNRFVADIETVLKDYDLVFATARMALEAAATGCAVVVCDDRGFAGMLTTTTLPAWQPRNFGASILTQQVTVERLGEAITQYDADDASSVTDDLRRTASAENFVARHLEIYRRAIDRDAPSADEIALASARWVEELAVSPTERKWKSIARELGIYDEPPQPTAPEGVSAEVFAAFTTRLAQQTARLEGAQFRLLSEIGAGLAQINAALDAQRDTSWQLARRLKQAFLPKSLRK
ncbi:glycosyltransferase [Aminobacter sp. SR38]|uniref:glycosyltransferase n=1 Tax=Aminobacter ciceronei TaxID=150723 RepID=UPI00177D5B20|nr:glycosyltransferase [Aminobacter sp. SR38]